MDKDVADLIAHGMRKLVGPKSPAMAVGLIGGIAFTIAGFALLRSTNMDQAMFPLIALAFLLILGGFYGLRYLRRQSVITIHAVEEHRFEDQDG